MPRPPQLVLSPLRGDRPAPQVDPAAYTAAGPGRSFRVVPLAALNTAPSTVLPLRRRQPPFRGPEATGPLFPTGPARRTRTPGAGLSAWFAGAGHARSAARGELPGGDGQAT